MNYFEVLKMFREVKMILIFKNINFVKKFRLVFKKLHQKAS